MSDIAVWVVKTVEAIQLCITSVCSNTKYMYKCTHKKMHYYHNSDVDI